MLLPENLVYAGAGWRAMGAETEGRIGHEGVGTAKAAEANCLGVGDKARADNSRGAPRALGVAQRCAGALEEPA